MARKVPADKTSYGNESVQLGSNILNEPTMSELQNLFEIFSFKREMNGAHTLILC